MDQVSIKGARVSALSQEGVAAELSVVQLMEQLAPPSLGDAVVLPDHAKHVFPRRRSTIFVCELPPAVRSVRWIAPDSPAAYGPGTTYRTYRLAMPYVIIFAVFDGPGTMAGLSHRNEVFFRKDPLKDLGDDLCFPALLNCSKFNPVDQRGKSLAWICTQHLNTDEVNGISDPNERVRMGIRKLIEHLFLAAFNRSSDVHEDGSWYTEHVSREVDPRIATVEEWQRQSEKDALFPLSVPFLRTGYTVRTLAERIFNNAGARPDDIRSARDIARIVFNVGKTSRPRKEEKTPAMETPMLLFS